MDSEQFFENQNTRMHQRSEEMHEKYFADLGRLRNYLRVLVETKAFKPRSNNSVDRNLYNEIQCILSFIDKQISSTDYLIRLLERLVKYDFGTMPVDEVNRMKVGIRTDRLRSLINNGAVMTDEEKESIILFINT